MPQSVFPLYRQSANGSHWYRIESEASFTEVQRVGRHYVAHRLEAKIYPDRLRVAELIAMADGHTAASDRATFDAVLALCRP